MRRILVFISAMVLILSLAVSVSAITEVTQVSTHASVSSDESCDISITATFHLDTAVSELYFPLPRQASNVTLNGSRIGSSISGDVRLIDLTSITGGMPGDFSAVVTFHLSDVVAFNENGLLVLEVPLLYGFDYPITKLECSVLLPGEIVTEPAFSSGYHHTNIEQDLTFSVSGATVTCKTLKKLKDHETLTMSLNVTDTMFPQSVIKLQNLEPLYVMMGICAGLALLYWILLLRNKPPRFVTVVQPLEGFSAGQLGSVLSLKGADLTMMVFSWAQLGYIFIQLDKRGRVLLYKRMEMGNERSFFEQKCFKTLFGPRSVIDASGLRYALTCQKIRRYSPNIQGLVHPKSGSFLVFRIFMMLLGALDGICLGLTLSAEAAVQWFPAALLALFCGASSWIIHLWADSMVSSRKGKLYIALFLSVCWLTLTLFAGTASLDLWVLLGQFLAGLMVTFGGRRTESGYQYMSEVMGLLRYLRSVPRAQVVHITQQNPDYFHDMAPYALALGVDKAFASRFGRMLIPECPYLGVATKGRLTAAQWSDVMHQIVRVMNAQQARLKTDSVMSVLRSFIR